MKAAPRNNLTPLKAISEALTIVGKPIYFLLSISISTMIQIIELTSTTVNWLIKKTSKRIKKFKKRSRRKVREIEKESKIKTLKIQLIEENLFIKIRHIFKKKITKIQVFRIKLGVKFLIIGLICLIITSYFYFFIFKSLPSPHELTKKAPQVSTKIYDRNGNLLYKIFKTQNRTIVPLSQIPIHVRLATLAAEDAEFYDHPGFSLKGIFRAFVNNSQHGSTQGGSTITQQLVKNVLLTPEKTISRKIKEIILSVEVETTYTKDQILEMYLNQVSYGGTSYGIEEASQEFFGKDVGDLSLGEAAFLAGLPRSPTTYSPYGQNFDAGFERQRDVLHLMVVNKFITLDQERETLEKNLVFVSSKNIIKAPHFVMYIRQLLVNKYGEEMVEKGGLEVTTSLDLSTQDNVQKIVTSEVEKLKGLNVNNGDALVLNPQTGEILAMVGSIDFFNSKNDGQVNVTLRLRQPGSSIKVVNYAYALSNGGYTPATIIDDLPITYSIPGSAPYSPVNYDGQFRGPVTLRSALAQSRNIPAVKILASYGVTKMIKQGQSMGIASWNDPSKFGLSLTLGGGAVTALDLSRVYATLANSGKTPEILSILQVKDYRGRVLEKNYPKAFQTLDPRVSFLLTDILKDNIARSPEFGLSSYLVIKDHPEVAVKTGTSNDLRDNWTAGYNQNYLVITWVGNNDNSPMSRVASGITGASPIWNKIMSSLLINKPSIDWKVPDGVSKINCPGGKSEWFKDDNVLPNFCSPVSTQNPGTQTEDKILNGASTISH